MAIIRTDDWLKKEFGKPAEICQRLLPYFGKQNAHEIYQQLLRFGMYRPSRPASRSFEALLQTNSWGKIEKIYAIYKEKWSGPEIPVFLFPMEEEAGLFRKSERNKSGVSFPNKMFLFLAGDADEKEMEALFVHEYHHVCRLNKSPQCVEENTLLDSMIIEGLAEYAVLKSCGDQYVADWCDYYSERQILHFWREYLKDLVDCTRKEKIHDDVLYGRRPFPRLIGYAAGFFIVKDYYRKNSFSIKRSFSIPSKTYIKSSRYM